MLVDPAQAALLKPAKRRHKYHAERTKVGDRCFHSKAEAARYCQLRKQVRDGHITKLTLQPQYPLFAGIQYVGDFEYVDHKGTTVTEDVKGMVTAAYRMKRKMFGEKYQREIVEVSMDNNDADVILQSLGRGQ